MRNWTKSLAIVFGIFLCGLALVENSVVAAGRSTQTQSLCRRQLEVRVLAASVRVRPPNEIDLRATLAENGYQIVSNLPPFAGLTEREMYRFLRAQFPNGFRSVYDDQILLGDDQRWHIVRGFAQKPSTNPETYVYLVEPIALSSEIADFLQKRLTFLERLRPSSDWQIDRRITLRVGQFQMEQRDFHYDTGNGLSFVETLNRDKRGRQATFFASADGGAFEPEPLQGVLFTSTRTSGFGPAALHSAPSRDGQRIFIRYGLLPPPPRNSHMRRIVAFVDGSGKLVGRIEQ